MATAGRALMLNKKSVGKNLAIYIAFEAVNKSLPFLLFPVLTHYLAPSEIGVVAEFMALIGIISVFIGLSTHGAISVTFFHIDHQKLSIYIYNCMLIMVSTTVVISAACHFLYYVDIQVSTIPSFWIQIAVLAAAMNFVSTVNLNLWQAEKKPTSYGIYQLLMVVTNVSLSLILVVILSYGWEGRVLGQVISMVIFGFVSVWVLLKRGYLTFEYSKKYILDALNFGVPLIPHVLCTWVFMGFNIILINSTLGAYSAGIFSAAMQFSLILSVFYTAVNRAVQPYFFSILKDVDHIGKYMLVRYIYMGMIGSIAIGFIFYFVALSSIVWILDGRYHDATQYLPYLIAAEVFSGMYYFVVKPIFFKKKTRYFLATTAVAAAVHVALASTIVHEFGMVGVAVSSVISMMLLFFMVWVASNSLYPLPWFKVRS